jgi:hypothetical protein
VASETSIDPGSATQESPAKRRKWHQRPTIRALKRKAVEEREFAKNWDRRDNDETRLPASEAVHLGGVVLVEAFTPSSVSALYKALEELPIDRPDLKQEWLAELTRSRRGASGGWRNLGTVRRPGSFIMGDGFHDAALPESVEAVWLHLSYTTPSLALLVATFTITEEDGDLSALLRKDYRTTPLDVRVRVYGRGAALRQKCPWARPARHGFRYTISRAEDQKRLACEAVIRRHEEACTRWFADRFRGRFAANPNSRPVMRLMFTQEQVPFKERKAWLRPVGLSDSLEVWRSTETELPGWALVLSRWPYRHEQPVVMVAARRRDAAEEPTAGESGESNWYLTQRFADDQAPLAARYAMTSLLSVYGDGLGDLRDRAGGRPMLRRPVQEAKKLDQYLIGDGLDSATITADIRLLTDDLKQFRWGVPEYTEDLEGYSPDLREKQELREFVPVLCSWLRNQTNRLSEDTATTTGNIRASAELRQAIANTRLQRPTLLLSLAAAVIAVISLLITKG